MVAATGVVLARGITMIEALRLGMAAGALNATGGGWGTGTREESSAWRRMSASTPQLRG
jgi:1-phosphofructokinase